MAVKVSTIIGWLEAFAPQDLAVDGDRIGLQIGSAQQTVDKVLITLDVTRAVVQEAIQMGAKLIVAHHPPLYHPLRTLNTQTAQGEMIANLIKHDIAVYAIHTNLDIVKGGLNDWLAERLGLKNTEVLAVTQHEQLKKLAVFVPLDYEEKVRLALGKAGAGHIGNYSYCTFRSVGTGTFKPEEGANPFIGCQGEIEQVEEVKLETIFPAHLEKKVLEAMLEAHPYEEVAYDIYPLEQKGAAYGLGRIGYLEQPMSLEEFALKVKNVLELPFCRVAGRRDARIHKVAVMGGDGNKYVNQAIRKGADVLVTGDLYYHTVLDALEAGLNLIDPGHHAEKIMIKGLCRVLEEKAREEKAEVEVIPSRIDTNPFYVL